MAHVIENATANKYMQVMTTHLAAPRSPCTLSLAYNDPTSSMTTTMAMPPRIVDVLRPHLSVYSVAGMVTAKITRADTPEARKEASPDARPACWNSNGA